MKQRENEKDYDFILRKYAMEDVGLKTIWNGKNYVEKEISDDFIYIAEKSKNELLFVETDFLQGVNDLYLIVMEDGKANLVEYVETFNSIRIYKTIKNGQSLYYTRYQKYSADGITKEKLQTIINQRKEEIIEMYPYLAEQLNKEDCYEVR